jgi:cation:H+ antiporter
VELLLWSLVFVASLTALVKAADWFTAGAERVGLWLGIPSFLVGATIVAIGTSLPELVSSIIAVTEGASEIVAGNIVGSNITNIFLVLGVAAIMGRRLQVTYETVRVDLPLLVGSSFMMVWVLYDRSVTVAEAIALLAGALIYMMYAASASSRRHARWTEDGDDSTDAGEPRVPAPGARTWLLLAGSVALLYVGAKYTVDSVVELAGILDVGPEIIAISAVALGTSLPELTVSVVAARRGNLETAMGNVLGSSIFNSFAVLGIPALIGDLTITDSVWEVGLPIMVGATLLYFFMTQEKELSHWEGWLLLVFYALFIAQLFSMA